MAVQVHSDEGRIARLVEGILLRAVQQRASDIHFESLASGFRVRFRIDGILHDQNPISEAFRLHVINRLKILASIDIAEKRVPQDGAFTDLVGTERMSFRVSTFPAEHGEKVVVRLLSNQAARPLRELGMPDAMARALERVVSQPHGMVLVTGPTGSGKTSTLYALLRYLEQPERNIVTLEDPIEYRFERITQGQTNTRSGFTFARGLRAILRQDPDIIMVGEMRDQETADTAFKAALTGHLVLSSLHTNSAVETVIRLFDMGLERYVIASSLRVLVGQRLARLLCEHCREPAPLDDAQRALLGAPPEAQHIFREVGCPRCNRTGFVGRTGLFEVIELDDAFAGLIRKDTTTRSTLAQEMARRGLRSIRRAGFDLVLTGRTSLDEVYRVT
ncbi:MAG: GspE/PulE family protein [Pseudomonadota bacterium]